MKQQKLLVLSVNTDRTIRTNKPDLVIKIHRKENFRALLLYDVLRGREIKHNRSSVVSPKKGDFGLISTG